MESYDEKKNTYFLARLKQLQLLCSNSDPNLPNALLFIPGPDGKHNKGSSVIIKYLFLGSVGKDLLDGTVDEIFELFEETIILIQEFSVSIFYSNLAKEKLGKRFHSVPILLEYIPTESEDQDIDIFEARKCIDFKRMILEAVPEGGVIGIPVPLGYEDVQDIESWPILQAFAAEQVYCSTGFFTSRYAVVDITSNLEILFRSVDSYYVDKAIEIIYKSILPHCLQTLSIMETQSAEQRKRLTVDNLLTPYELLFDFGCLEAGEAVDPLLKPVILVGAASRLVGTDASRLPKKWRDQRLGSHEESESGPGESLHLIVEAAEPSTGMRWCRTYFLAHGRHLEPHPSSATALIGATAQFSEKDIERFHQRACVLRRLEGLYMKLWFGLRHAVTVAFSANRDVLEAGSAVQSILENIINKNSSVTSHGLDFESLGLSELDGVYLTKKEQLQVHMDCMDALGKVVTVEDVDDMGGQCWVYFRVAVHGIDAAGAMSQISTQTISIAVGDTFLFSPAYAVLLSGIKAVEAGSVGGRSGLESLPGLESDRFCMTHVIPYFRAYVGAGLEEESANHAHSTFRSISSRMDDGNAQSTNDPQQLEEISLPIITDHPMYPTAHADIYLHSNGIFVHRLNQISTLPVFIDLTRDVESVTTLDSSQCFDQILAIFQEDLFDCQEERDDGETQRWRDGLKASMTGREGLLIVFQLKSHLEEVQEEEEGDDDADDGDDSKSNKNRVIVANPLVQALGSPCSLVAPSDLTVTELKKYCRNVGLFVESGSKETTVISKALNKWRRVLFANDIPEYRGRDKPLPISFLRSFYVALDTWTSSKNENSNFELDEVYGVATTRSSGRRDLGMNLLRYSFVMAESIRMSKFESEDFEKLLADDSMRNKQFSKHGKDLRSKAIVVIGPPASGALTVANYLYSQSTSLYAADKGYASRINMFFMDLCDPNKDLATSLAPIEDIISTRAAMSIICITLSPLKMIPPARILSLLDSKGISIQKVVAMGPASMSPKPLKRGILLSGSDSSKGLEQFKKIGLGPEAWVSCAYSVFAVETCDIGGLVSDSTRFVSSRALIEIRNPYATILRIDPSNIHLDEEVKESFFGTGSQSNSRNMFTSTFARHIRCLSDCNLHLQHSPRISISEPSLGKGLHITSLDSPEDGSGIWDPRLLQICLQYLFPAATNGSPKLDDSWSVPTNRKNLGGLHYAVFLAKIKVFSKKKQVEAKKELEKKFQSIGKEDLKDLRDGLLSVHGLISCEKKGRQDTSQVYLVEGCSDHVFIRLSIDKDDMTGKQSKNKLIICGIFDQKQIDLIHNILSWCGQYFMHPAHPVTIEDIPKEKMMLLQADHFDDPLPYGWFSDGQLFLDFNGSRRELRPDIDAIVSDYLSRRNVAVDNYNQFLEEVKDFI